jgi:hypothetical protein
LQTDSSEEAIPSYQNREVYLDSIPMCVDDAFLHDAAHAYGWIALETLWIALERTSRTFLFCVSVPLELIQSVQVVLVATP